nr:SAGA-associated factor 11 homolog isoform X1 [Tanacetum cinerariifolium]
PGIVPYTGNRYGTGMVPVRFQDSGRNAHPYREGHRRVMSTSDENNKSDHTQLASNFFDELVDSMIMDVASESHRIARLGLDRNLDDEEEELRLSAQARARVADSSHSEANSKYVVDIFGQTHPPVASEIFDCMNCGRSIVAGRFAPHLEKCMGKIKKPDTVLVFYREGRPVLNQQEVVQLRLLRTEDKQFEVFDCLSKLLISLSGEISNQKHVNRHRQMNVNEEIKVRDNIDMSKSIREH